MNKLDQFFAWWHAPASHGQTGGGWLDWFALLSRGWSAPTRDIVSPQAAMADVTNGQALVSLLDQLVSK